MRTSERECPFRRKHSEESEGWYRRRLLLFIKKLEMGKKRSCQDVKVPRPLNEVESRLYGWVEEAFRHNYPLVEDLGMEGDYVLEVAGLFDRVPFRADEGSPHFLWVYQELFTRLRVRLPFSDFQRDVMTRCGMAVSQLHLNGWGFILAFEREFKWHYFKVLSSPGKRAFWLDHENKPFSWVYWNLEVKDFTVFNLEPLEMAAFKFLVSLPASLPKKNKFTCRWILDSSDAEVGKFLDDLLDVKMKKTKLDNQLAMMADPASELGWLLVPFCRPVVRLLLPLLPQLLVLLQQSPRLKCLLLRLLQEEGGERGPFCGLAAEKA
ncbi:hypothetical protein PIB30_074180 [Stylosanthes scabra]|uniref:Uncharacterized protein n=1 Tax=Stylosanthes scabra TaxID=79078 RepID=A0ABU6SQV5_9FABA|nr:hypothetical protein [Stylosanthes scabra]